VCVIVDANLFSQVFTHPVPSDFEPIHDWIDNQGGALVFGGSTLAKEISRVGDARRRILEWSRQGKARQVPAAQVDIRARELEHTGACESNDTHVIALAQLSGSRVLCSLDRALTNDFKNKTLLSGPRGSVYRKASHRHLLAHTPHCIGRPSRHSGK
jgi:predicted nucleic acid-binding protein